MSRSNNHLTSKFFRPSQRAVSCHNGLLDTRTKNIVAQDRLITAEQRLLDVEQRKSASYLQLLAFEQKQLEKRYALHHDLNRSTSESNLPRASSWNGGTTSMHQTLLSQPQIEDFSRRFSSWSDEASRPSTPDDEEEESNSKKHLPAPSVAITPPDDDEAP